MFLMKAFLYFLLLPSISTVYVMYCYNDYVIDNSHLKVGEWTCLNLPVEPSCTSL